MFLEHNNNFLVDTLNSQSCNLTFTNVVFTIILRTAFDYVQAGSIVAYTKNKYGPGHYMEEPTHYCCDLKWCFCGLRQRKW
ncbi:hypothetical protein WALSEDRAFT_59948 [Wallemia mellicola CBS 633.66]|uniref:Uncharacterized protein n=1 Tax=Wallemia mellicola (strain ATCC MYA-4683 / CBS 633.66) TaxID=671144 RepID=I4YFQ8_WALMC|nr:hypothetical protein WALSEDRAFT_59948 [Wallemia mellicola CBS 633.66]EIM22800.1 hypothetical protein WALSEDRAFT_59948 [Wallemia mellicola CBS 633.66]|eukprot:XP_006957454.1 hypothetical protein WALSEDRAFT_59948 [Wallemia mellicola CBS 633.66]